MIVSNFFLACAVLVLVVAAIHAWRGRAERGEGRYQALLGPLTGWRALYVPVGLLLLVLSHLTDRAT